jgi:hypothetical protein
MKSSIPKNCPTSEIKLKLIPRGSHIFQKKRKICIRRFLPTKKKTPPKLKVITKAKNQPTLV